MPALGKTSSKFVFACSSLFFGISELKIKSEMIVNWKMLIKKNITSLQVQGLGTALKILYSGKFDEDISASQNQPQNINDTLRQRFKLKRSEIVALFNAFGRYGVKISFFLQKKQLFLDKPQ